ncbi:hypothetical protein [Ancylobacter oerskovii]|uniref:Capsular polysaccharide transport system permease protein n=1 Tax=Ancylobacter oerskovii TaxID=459519 RepID=A0ABW4YW27_9HYPH|nr:hypothetical protein [Ancylobacter oerskovii]MBS7544282.1 hypothetical protein [Ancylobacter oerskovii]
MTDTTRRNELLAFSSRLSDDLRRSARQARVRNMAAGQRKAVHFVRRLPWLAAPLQAVSRLSFLLCVVVPSVLLIIYYGFIASSQYYSEARFAVRAGDTTSLDTVTALTGLPSVTQFQDSTIVVEYLKSRAIVEALEQKIQLSKLFNRSGVDWFSRLDEGAPIEAVVAYWRHQVTTSVEMPSGIITVRVNAFSPEDAVTITNAVVDLSEELVNKLGERARRDLITSSEHEVARAEDRLREARSALKDWRNEVGMLDPTTASQGIQGLIATLKTEQLKLRQEISTGGRSLSANAPQLQLLKWREEATQEQIDILERQLTSPAGQGKNTIANVITRYEEIELNRTLAERMYTLAASNFERARINSERQQLYLNTFVQPSLPDEPSGPKRTRNILLGMLVFFCLWAGGTAFLRFRQQLRSK